MSIYKDVKTLCDANIGYRISHNEGKPMQARQTEESLGTRALTLANTDHNRERPAHAKATTNPKKLRRLVRRALSGDNASFDTVATQLP
jgi:hypothetical protein